jgi:hypothetical protein
MAWFWKAKIFMNSPPVSQSVYATGLHHVKVRATGLRGLALLVHPAMRP